MTNAQIERLLDRMVEVLPALMTEKGYGRDSCILHSRVAVDFLRRRGLRVRALTVSVSVFNEPWAAWLQELGRMPTNDDQPPTNIWSVHIGSGAPDEVKARPGYDGHVIVIVNERYAVDLTIDQASRPAKGILVGPHWWVVDHSFITGASAHAFVTTTHTYVRYEAMPEERGFLTVPDWTLPSQGGSLPTDAELEAIAA